MMDYSVSMWITSFCWFVTSVLLQTGIRVSSQERVTAGVHDYCETETFNATCQHGEVIVMKSAHYGRMRLGRCVRKDLGYIGCAKDVLLIADRKCSGRQSCMIRIPDPEFDTTHPCLDELKTYFEASFSCRKVWWPEHQDQCRLEREMLLKNRTGYIASSTTAATGCGSSQHPYLIQAKPGQQINISIYDFTSETPPGNTLPEHVHTYVPCFKYAIFEERIELEGHTVADLCAGHPRHRHAYISTNHSLQITIVTDQHQQTPFFMLKYEVIGCGDVELSQGAFQKRDGNDVIIGCMTSDQTWRLKCVDNTWTGLVGNCSHYDIYAMDEKDVRKTGHSFGTSVIIIFLMAFLVGVIVFSIGFVVFKRCKTQRGHGTHMSLSTAEPGPDAELHAGKHVTLHLPVEQKTPCQKLPQTSDATPQTQQDGNEYAHIWQCTLHKPEATDCHVKDNERNATRQCQTLPASAKHSAACIIGDRTRPMTLSGEPEEFYSPGMGTFHSHVPGDVQMQHERLPDVTLPRSKHHPRVEATKHAPTCSFAKPRYFVLDKDAVLKEVTAGHSREGHHGDSRPEHTRHAATLDFRTFKH